MSTNKATKRTSTGEETQNASDESNEQVRSMAKYDIRAGDVPSDLFPTQRLKFSLGVPRSTKAERDAAKKKLPDVVRREKMEELREHFAWDVLHGIQSGRLHVAEVVRRMEEDGKSAIRALQNELAAPPALPEAKAEQKPLLSYGEMKQLYLSWFKTVAEPASYDTRRSRLDRSGKQFGADGVVLDAIEFGKVTSTDIEAVLEALGVGPVTRESYRVSISAVFTRQIQVEQEEAEKEGREPRWNRNPAALIPSTSAKRRVRAATREEISRLLAVAEPYQEAYIRVSAQLGIRQGELQHLRLKADLNLATWTMRIQERGPDPRCSCKKCQGKGWKPKNANGTRKFHIPASHQALRNSLLRLLEMYPVEENDFIFKNPRTGRVWTTKGLQEDFVELCERAGVPYGREDPDAITWHSLRHSCATNLVRAGVTMKKIADILGDTVDTIEKYYVDLDEHDLGHGIGQGPAFD